MKKNYFSVLLCLCVCLITGCNKKQDPVVDLKSSNIFTQEELQGAKDALIDEFSDEWQDCILEKVVYSGDESSRRKAEYYGYEKGVEFLINFKTGSHSSPSLNLNGYYEEYQFFLVYEDGKWVVDYGACGYG